MALVCAGISACTTSTPGETSLDAGFGFAQAVQVAAEPEPTTHGGGRYQIGKPYQIGGTWFTPQDDPDYSEVGLASWYGPGFHGRQTANGETFDQDSLSAAHPTLPLPSYVRVTNLENDRSVVVRVNDRGPFSHRRLIDVSSRTADILDFKHAGMAEVQVDYVDRAPIEGESNAFLLATYRGPDGVPAPVGEWMLASAAPPVPRAPPAVTPVGFSGEPLDSYQLLRGGASESEWMADPAVLRSSYAADSRVSAAFEAIRAMDRQ